MKWKVINHAQLEATYAKKIWTLQILPNPYSHWCLLHKFSITVIEVWQSGYDFFHHHFVLTNLCVTLSLFDVFLMILKLKPAFEQ